MAKNGPGYEREKSFLNNGRYSSSASFTHIKGVREEDYKSDANLLCRVSKILSFSLRGEGRMKCEIRRNSSQICR
jgi:hypothetical protein